MHPIFPYFAKPTPFDITPTSAIGRRRTAEFVGRFLFHSSSILYSRSTRWRRGTSPQEYRYYSVETGQEAARRRVKRKAIRARGGGWRSQDGRGGWRWAAEGESKVVLAIRVRTSMCRLHEYYLRCTGWLVSGRALIFHRWNFWGWIFFRVRSNWISFQL